MALFCVFPQMRLSSIQFACFCNILTNDSVFSSFEIFDNMGDIFACQHLLFLAKFLSTRRARSSVACRLPLVETSSNDYQWVYSLPVKFFTGPLKRCIVAFPMLTTGLMTVSNLEKNTKDYHDSLKTVLKTYKVYNLTLKKKQMQNSMHLTF